MSAKMVSTATTFISILLLAGLLANEAFQNYPTRPLASSFLHSSFRIQKSPSSLLVASAASAERSLETQTGSINYSSSPNNIADNDGNSQTTLQNKKQRQNHDNGNNSQSSSTTKATSTSIQDLKLASSSPTTLAKLQRYKSTKALESSIMKLGRMGKFEEALELYFGVWFVDGWRVKERQREQKRKNNSSDSTVPATNDDKQQQQQQQTKIINAISPQLRPTTRLMNLAIDACARANPVQQQMAFDLFRDATAEGALSPNVFTFGSLLASFARNGDIDSSLALLDTLEKGIEYPDVIPNGVIYSTVISACERSNPPRVGLALELLNNATLALSLGGGGSSGSGNRSSSSGVGVVGFNAAMSTMARAAQWQMAVRLLDEMILHSNSSMESFRHSTSHASLLHVLSRNEDDADANENRDENKIIIIPRPDEVTFGTVLAACERSGEWEELLRIAKIARHNGVELDGMALTSVLHACQQLGLAEEALEYLDLMKRLGGGGSEEEHTNNGSARSSNIVYTERRTRGRMRKGAKQSLRGPDGVAYRLAISACARASNGARWRDGIQLLNEMRESALRSNSTDEAPDVVAYTAAIAGCSEAGEYTHAMKLIQTMRREGIMPNVVTFSAVITACASASANLVRKREEGDRSIDLEDVQLPMSRALRLLEVMTSSPFMVRPNIVTYNAAIRACAEGLNLEGAFDLLRQLKEKGLEPTIVTYGSLMTACERVGNIEAASKVFRMVKEDDGLEENGIQANEIIYGAAISCCRKAGQVSHFDEMRIILLTSVELLHICCKLCYTPMQQNLISS